MRHSKEFTIDHTDKVQEFIEETITTMKDNHACERVFKLAADFACNGKTRQCKKIQQTV